MSAGDVVQFYAPFAGLMALAFWMGVLSQRVRQLEKTCDHDGLRDQVTRLEVKMEAVEKHVGNIEINMQSINRQLGNIAMRRVGKGIEIPGEGG